jgi:putative transcriptional regulator
MNEDLKSLRARLGMTQEDLAHTIGVTVSTVNRWENGHFKPSRLARSALAVLQRVAAERPAEPQS